MKRKALGKGLDALLPSAGVSSGEASRTLTKLGIEEIHRNPRQPRQYFNKEKLHELAESIKSNGILQPIIVRKSKDGFEIVAGERRWRAAQEAGETQVPCIIQSVGDREILELALIENIQRDDLSPIEEASAYKMMLDEFTLTQEEIAKKVGKSRVAVTNTLRLLQLPLGIQAMVTEGKLSMGHARALIPLPKESLQNQLSREIIKSDLSVRQTENKVRGLLQSDEKKTDHTPDPNVTEARQRLEEHWKTRIEIKGNDRSGKIIFFYQSSEERDRIYDELLGQ
jgi:ParB family transcriptional regulator, chromosome partitioning protein